MSDTTTSSNSWFTLIDHKTINPKAITELDIAIRVANVLACEDYIIESFSNKYYHSEQIDRIRQLHDICGNKKHTGGSDIIIKNQDFERIGVEVKRVLSFHSFQTALGQTITFLHNPQYVYNKTKEGKMNTKFNFIAGIIFANNFVSERLAKDIQNIMKNIDEPIIIRTLFGVGDSKIKNIVSRFYKK
jgi:hypothetical protein